MFSQSLIVTTIGMSRSAVVPSIGTQNVSFQTGVLPMHLAIVVFVGSRSYGSFVAVCFGLFASFGSLKLMTVFVCFDPSPIFTMQYLCVCRFHTECEFKKHTDLAFRSKLRYADLSHQER